MIVTVIGARPQFVKAAVVSRALKSKDIPELIVHTGQHYDEKMSNVFWSELGIPPAAVNLQVGSGLQGAQTARTIEKLEAYLLSLPALPKAILIYGDTNSTLAASIVASKLLIPIIHVEAGLRSFNRAMPEEVNRIVTDHLSAVLFCSSPKGIEQLRKEGITTNVYNVGDVMHDAICLFRDSNMPLPSPISELMKSEFCVLTLHRPSNTDNRQHLTSILAAIGSLPTNVLWPVHPRLRSTLDAFELPQNIHITEPLSYGEMINALKHCSKVLTDSGGLQKEAYWLQKPCITLREETEWVETLEGNWNMVCGTDADKILSAFNSVIDKNCWKPLYGIGDASDRIATTIKQIFYSE